MVVTQAMWIIGQSGSSSQSRRIGKRGSRGRASPSRWRQAPPPAQAASPITSPAISTCRRASIMTPRPVTSDRGSRGRAAAFVNGSMPSRRSPPTRTMRMARPLARSRMASGTAMSSSTRPNHDKPAASGGFDGRASAAAGGISATLATRSGSERRSLFKTAVGLSIFALPVARPAMAINVLRNKPIGPGGGTRRLHPNPGPMAARPQRVGFRRGRNRIDEGVKGELSLGMVPPLSGLCNSCQRQLCSGGCRRVSGAKNRPKVLAGSTA